MLKKLKELSIHTHFVIRTVITVIGLILVLISQASGRSGLFGLILIFLGILWHLLFVRCPHCGSHFSLRRAIPRYCPWCGKYIDKFH